MSSNQDNTQSTLTITAASLSMDESVISCEARNRIDSTSVYTIVRIEEDNFYTILLAIMGMVAVFVFALIVVPCIVYYFWQRQNKLMKGTDIILVVCVYHFHTAGREQTARDLNVLEKYQHFVNFMNYVKSDNHTTHFEIRPNQLIIIYNIAAFTKHFCAITIRLSRCFLHFNNILHVLLFPNSGPITRRGISFHRQQTRAKQLLHRNRDENTKRHRRQKTEEGSLQGHLTRHGQRRYPRHRGPARWQSRQFPSCLGFPGSLPAGAVNLPHAER